MPTTLITSISGLKHGGVYKNLSTLAKHKLIHHEQRKYDGYKLTWLGFDFLALRALMKGGVVSAVGNQIGVGKESDIFVVANEEGTQMALKLHRLGRVSFRTVKRNRDYTRKSASWMYLSRLAAKKEHAFMTVLKETGFPVPTPHGQNRHCVVMDLVDAYPMVQVRTMTDPGVIYSKLMNLLVRFAEHGLIHGDFNEHNLMVSDDGEVTVIDFPQMVSTSHADAQYYFDRDVQCVITWFKKRYRYESEFAPQLDRDTERVVDLDVQVAASGFSREDAQDFDTMYSKHSTTLATTEVEEYSDDGQDGEGGDAGPSSVAEADGGDGAEEEGGDADEGLEGSEEEGGDGDDGDGDEDGKIVTVDGVVMIKRKKVRTRAGNKFARKRLERQKRQRNRAKRRNRVKNRSAIEDRRIAKERF